MNAEQLQKTLRASQYAEQVLGLHQAVLEKDYQIDQFTAPLSPNRFTNLYRPR